MAEPVKPSAAALATADAICKKHGMLPGGYMRDSLAEDLEAFAAQATTEQDAALELIRGTIATVRRTVETVEQQTRARCRKLICQGCQQDWPLVDIEGDLMHQLPPELVAPHEYGSGTLTACEAAAIHQDDGRALGPAADPPVASILGQPIGTEDLKRISRDGP